MYSISSPSLPYLRHDPATSVSIRVVMVTPPDVSATLAKASPRKPSEVPPIRLRSSIVWILLVKACLHTNWWSSEGIPYPLSLTWMTSREFCDISTTNEVLAASSALSTSSFTTEHGSVMAEVEPMARTVVDGRAVIGMFGSVNQPAIGQAGSRSIYQIHQTMDDVGDGEKQETRRPGCYCHAQALDESAPPFLPGINTTR